MDNPLRGYMDEAGFTVQEFAFAIGVNGGMIYHYLRGVPAHMSAQFAWKLSKLGIDPGEAMLEYSRWRESQAKRVLQQMN